MPVFSSDGFDLVRFLEEARAPDGRRRVHPTSTRPKPVEPDEPLVGEFRVIQPHRAGSLERLLDDRVGRVPVDGLDPDMRVRFRGPHRGLQLEWRSEDVELAVGVRDRHALLEQPGGHIEQIEERLVEVGLGGVRDHQGVRRGVESTEDFLNAALHRPAQPLGGFSLFAGGTQVLPR
jgi:hypothetical protein